MFRCIECESDFQPDPCWIHAKNVVSDRKTAPLAIASLPDILYFEPSDALAENGTLSDCKSVHTSIAIPAHTVFGPLMAPLFRSNAPSEDGNPDRTDLQCFQLDNDYFCNWMKYVHFASSREEQNLAVVLRGEDVVFVTTRSISPGEALKIYYTEELEDAAFLKNDNLTGMAGENCAESSGNDSVTEEISTFFTSPVPGNSDLPWPETVSIRGAREYQILPPDESVPLVEDCDNMGSISAPSRRGRKSTRSGYASDATYEEGDDSLSESSSDSSTFLRSGTKRKKIDRSIGQKNGLAETLNRFDGEERPRGRPRKLLTVRKADEGQEKGESLTKSCRGRPRKNKIADTGEGTDSIVLKPKPPKRLSKKAKFLARMKALEATGDLGNQRKKKEKLRKYPKKLMGADYDAFVYRLPCPDCPLHFYSRAVLSIHRYQHGTGSEETANVSEMKCIDCGHTTTNLTELSLHMDEHGMAVDTTLETVAPEHRTHPNCYFYACERGGCWKWFCTETQLKQHRLLHYPALPVDFDGLVCSQCGYAAVNAANLAEHVTHHGRTPKDGFYCGICQREIMDSMIYHGMRCHEDYYDKISLDFSYPCSLCSVRFPTEISRKRHACKNKRPQCYMCARQFADFQHLNAHLPSHEINGKYPCPGCDFLSVNASAILLHIAKAHDVSGARVCPVCQKVVKNANRMYWHMKTHDNTMNFLCHQCGKRFNTSRYLQQHRHYMHGTEMRVRIKRKLEEKRARGEAPARVNTKGLRLEDYPFRCVECRVGFLREGPHVRHMHEKHLV